MVRRVKYTKSKRFFIRLPGWWKAKVRRKSKYPKIKLAKIWTKRKRTWFTFFKWLVSKNKKVKFKRKKDPNAKTFQDYLKLKI